MGHVITAIVNFLSAAIVFGGLIALSVIAQHKFDR